MNHSSTAMRTTIVFGLIAAIFFTPLQFFLAGLLAPPMPLRLTVWVYMGLYSLLMVRWGRKNIGAVVFPVLALLILAFLTPSQNAFLLTALVFFSWMRSGVCFPGHPAGRMGVELMLCLGAGFLIASFGPRTGLTWVLSVWLFFLIQSVYFLLLQNTPANGMQEDIPADPFETARKQAEKILSEEV